MPKEDPFVNRAQLLKAIKKYPEIWDSNNKLHMCRSVTAPMWHEIAEQFGGHVPTGKLIFIILMDCLLKTQLSKWLLEIHILSMSPYDYCH